MNTQLESAFSEIAALNRALLEVETERDAYRAALCDIVAARKAWRDAMDGGYETSYAAYMKLSSAIDRGRDALATPGAGSEARG